MDGWRGRLLILTLGLKALSADAESAFSISEVSVSGVNHKCYGFQSMGHYYAPSHCFDSSSSYLLHPATNPLHGIPIKGNKKIEPEDLTEIELSTPPKGELTQRVLSCFTSDISSNKFVHSCTDLKAGDSGSLISNKNGDIIGIHLGIIYYAGKQFGYGLKYQSIIEHNLNDKHRVDRKSTNRTDCGETKTCQ